MKLYFKRGVMGGFIITILAISGLGIYSYIGSRRLIEGSAVRNESLKFASFAERVLVNAIDLETGQRGYLISGDSTFLKPYNSAVQSIDNNLQSLEAAAVGKTARLQLAAKLKEFVKKKKEIASATIVLRNESFDKAQAKVANSEGRMAMDSIRATINKIHAAEGRVMNDEAAVAEGQLDIFQYAFTGALVVPAVVVVILFYSINKNLMKREEAVLRLQRANQEITKLNSELESFTYSVSHDLRAPLRSVNGYANVLIEDYGHLLDQEAKRTISVIAKNGRRMGQLIDDLLDFSRLGRKELQRSSLSMDEMVSTIIEEIRETDYFNPKARIDVKVLPAANADVGMMRQVWHNLITNALKYSGKSENPAVEIGSFLRDNDVCYYVKDNGVGFNMMYVNKLFGVFQRLHKDEEFEGTGVGLALTKRIIDRHEGRVWAEGVINEGATFYFSLPR